MELPPSKPSPAMTSLRPWMPVGSAIVPVFVATLLLSASSASAQFGRFGGYQARFMQQSMQAAQKQAEAMQQQQKADYDAFMKRFDTNKNGKIDGKEKGPAQKYLRQKEMGIDPDKAINSLGRPGNKSTSTRTKRSSTK